VARIDPYKVNPVPPTVAYLDCDGRAVDELGDVHELETLPRGTRVYGSWDTVDALLGAGEGEAYIWNEEPVRWRHRRFDDGPIGWSRRHTDVTVIRLPFPADPTRVLAGLAGWRDWLGRYGAAPQGSLGSSAMSLLRATIREPLRTAAGALPPVRWTLGGRQQLLVEPRTSFADAVHLDLPAAYSSTLGTMRYGGFWRELEAPALRWLESSSQAGAPVLAHARVRVPASLAVGPVPRRPRRQPGSVDASWDMCDVMNPAVVGYPTGVRLAGTWSWPELAEAIEAGCAVDVDRAWVHVTRSGALGQPFLPWWGAVQEGRAMPGFAGGLAKASANALWGQFCIGEGRRMLRRGDGSVRLLPAPGGGMPRSWDLAELITGAVRAKLAGLMRRLGAGVLSVHTDGGWTDGVGEPPDGWLVKAEATRLDLIGPQSLRYWREGSRGGALYCVSGVAPARAESWFEERWSA
jgi:hypothetical protein